MSKWVSYCNECRWFKNREVCGRCRSLNLFTKADTSQTDCETCKHNSNYEPRISMIIEAYAKGFKDGAEAVKEVIFPEREGE